MKLTGHKTESVYRRYAIVSESDLADGVKKLGTLLKTDLSEPKTVSYMTATRLTPPTRSASSMGFPSRRARPARSGSTSLQRARSSRRGVTKP